MKKATTKRTKKVAKPKTIDIVEEKPEITEELPHINIRARIGMKWLESTGSSVYEALLKLEGLKNVKSTVLFQVSNGEFTINKVMSAMQCNRLFPQSEFIREVNFSKFSKLFSF